MQSLFNRVRKAVIPASVLLTCQQLLANSGIQLPLSQFQAGTEHANLVNNGAFTQHGPLDANGLTHQADNWDQFGGIYVTNQPFNPPPNVAALGGAVAIAKSGEDTPDQYSQPVNPTALNPGANYVLSAYIWNRGRPDQGLTSGDLAIVKIVDTTNAIDHNLSLVLDPAAADGGSGGNGYFIYDMINQSEMATWDPANTEIEVRGEDDATSGTRPDIWAQFDNIALTPAQQFVGHKWIGATGGNWGDGTQWNSQSQPSIKGAIVSFTDAISTDTTVNVESGKTCAVINFDNAHRYTLSGVGQITLDTQVHSGYDAAHPPVSNGVAGINVLSGSHTIAVNMAMSRDTVINVAPANSTLTISGTLTSLSLGVGSAAHSGQLLTKIGAGALEMKSLLIPNVSVQEGSVKMLAGGGQANASRINSLTIAGALDAWTSKLDLTNNDMAIDYTGASPIDTVQNQIKNGFASGSWNGNGITSSSAQASTNPKTAIGFGEASTLGVGTFDGAAVDPSTLLIKYTVSGDANLDGRVNALDFNALASNFGGASATWVRGDFNYDGVVNTLDFSQLAANFNRALPGPALGGLVPEPAMIWTFACVLLARRKHRMSCA